MWSNTATLQEWDHTVPCHRKMSAQPLSCFLRHTRVDSLGGHRLPRSSLRPLVPWEFREKWASFGVRPGSGCAVRGMVVGNYSA